MSVARFVGPVDRILFLRTLPALAGLSMRDLARIASRTSEQSYRKGQVLSALGKPIREFFMIVSGSVTLRMDDLPILHCSAGESVGLIPALARVGEQVEAIADEDTLTLVFELDLMFEIFEENFAMMQRAIRNLAREQLGLLRRSVAGTVRAPWVGTPYKVPARELDVVEKLVLLRRGNIFRNIGLEALVLMATSMVQERWPAGTQLWSPGDPADHLLVILDGEAECHLEGNGGSFVAGPGYPLGNIETLAGAERWYTPSISRELVTMRGNHEALFDVLEDDFDVAVEFLGEMARGAMASIQRLAARAEQPLRSGTAIETR